MLVDKQRRLRDIDVAYTECGNGDSVVMVHGLAEDQRSFSAVQQELSQFHTYAYALRGHGNTSIGEADGNLRIHDIPTGIYTSPEISSVGQTERELTDAKVPYEVGQAQFKSLARAQITGSTGGMLKLLFHRETLEILGVHCFGDNASEIVHIGQAIMNQPGENNSVNYFIKTTFNYPTMAEAYRVAALNGINRLF